MDQALRPKLVVRYRRAAARRPGGSAGQTAVRQIAEGRRVIHQPGLVIARELAYLQRARGVCLPAEGGVRIPGTALFRRAGEGDVSCERTLGLIVVHGPEKVAGIM